MEDKIKSAIALLRIPGPNYVNKCLVTLYAVNGNKTTEMVFLAAIGNKIIHMKHMPNCIEYDDYEYCYYEADGEVTEVVINIDSIYLRLDTDPETLYHVVNKFNVSVDNYYTERVIEYVNNGYIRPKK